MTAKREETRIEAQEIKFLKIIKSFTKIEKIRARDIITGLR